MLYFILSSLICQVSFTLPPSQISLLSSAGNWYQGVQAVLSVLSMTVNKSIAQYPIYYPILENIGQYPIPQCQYRSNHKQNTKDMPQKHLKIIFAPHEKLRMIDG